MLPAGVWLLAAHACVKTNACCYANLFAAVESHDEIITTEHGFLIINGKLIADLTVGRIDRVDATPVAVEIGGMDQWGLRGRKVSGLHYTNIVITECQTSPIRKL